MMLVTPIDITTALRNLLLRKLSLTAHRALVQCYERFCAKNYSSVPADRRREIIDGALAAFAQSPITNTGQPVNCKAYFDIVLKSKFNDFFRSQPDGIFYERIKKILQTPSYRRIGKWNRTAIAWDRTFWQPSDWPVEAEKACQQDIEALHQHSHSFADEAIEITERRDSSLLVRDEALAAYIKYLFSLTDQALGRKKAMRAADIKEIICTKLWIVPRPETSESIEYRNSDEHDGETWSAIDSYPVNELDPYVILGLERELTRLARDEKTKIHAWLLYQRAQNPSIGTPQLQKEIRLYGNLPALGHETLNKRLHELSELIRKREIDITFEGAVQVIIHVLSRIYKPLNRTR